MDKIISFSDLYSFRGEFNHTVVIYNSDDKTLLHFGRIEGDRPGFVVEYGDNYVDRRESFTHVVITIDENLNLYPIAENTKFDLRLFSQLGFAYESVEFIIPDDAPVDEIKEELLKINNQDWREIKNGLGAHLGYIMSLVSIKVIPSKDFYVEKNPFDDESDTSIEGGEQC